MMATVKNTSIILIVTEIRVYDTTFCFRKKTFRSIEDLLKNRIIIIIIIIRRANFVKSFLFL